MNKHLTNDVFIEKAVYAGFSSTHNFRQPLGVQTQMMTAEAVVIMLPVLYKLVCWVDCEDTLQLVPKYHDLSINFSSDHGLPSCRQETSMADCKE